MITEARKPLSLFSTVAVEKALKDVILDAYTKETGFAIDVTFAPTYVLLDRISAGERPDVMIVVTQELGPLAAAGVIELGTRTPVCRAGIGIAVDPKLDAPDISTVEALIETLTRARSIAYSRNGASGVYFARLLDELGIADQVNAKATILSQGLTARAVLDGRADLAVQQMSELLVIPEAKFVGPLPDLTQHYTEFSAAIGTGAIDKGETMSLLKFLISDIANEAYIATGLDTP